MEVYKNLKLKNIDGEIWKEVEGYDGDYYVSNFSRVKSFKKWPDVRILKPSEDVHGYLFVNLYKNRKQKPKRIHILIYESFNNYKLKNNECIHHIDFTKDNILDNFKLMIKKEHDSLHKGNENNPMFGKKHSKETKQLMREKKIGKYIGENNQFYGKHHSEKTKKLMSENHANFKGENHPNSKLTEEKVIQIRKLCDEGILTQAKIAEAFGVSPQTISLIKNRKLWKL